jgi:hypothetical protein
VPTFSKSIEVAAPLEETFRYVADFTTAAEWDPGIAESRRVNNGPPGVGATWDVVALLRGSRVPFRYQITEYLENQRIMLVGQGAKARSVDEIRFQPSAGGTRIDYRAELKMKGFSRITEPFLGGSVGALGAQALAGLKAKLDAGR